MWATSSSLCRRLTMILCCRNTCRCLSSSPWTKRTWRCSCRPHGIALESDEVSVEGDVVIVDEELRNLHEWKRWSKWALISINVRKSILLTFEVRERFRWICSMRGIPSRNNGEADHPCRHWGDKEGEEEGTGFRLTNISLTIDGAAHFHEYSSISDPCQLPPRMLP